jgi:hypothetical protein
MGEPDHQHLLTSVGPDGSHLWTLVDPDHRCDDCLLPHPPSHERTGPLPRAVRAAVWPCQAATRTRRPCRNPAPVGHTRCASHLGWPGRAA